MLSVIGFLIILGPLVVVHEFGHYLFARLFGVKAEVFSIGFGPKLFARKIGETEWRVSAIPLGGYVKLLGEDREAELSPEDAKRALHKAAPWKRFFIFFGGPLFNFLFAIVLFMTMMLYGENQVASVAARVVRGSVAEKAGFQSGDRILKVDGKPVVLFEEVLEVLNTNKGTPMQFEVRHPGTEQPAAVSVTPGTQSGYTVYGEQARVGDIDGLLPYGRSTHVGVSNPGSVVGKAGIKTGEGVTEFAGKPVTSWEALEVLYREAAPGSQIPLKITAQSADRKSDGAVRVVTLSKPLKSTQEIAQDWGLHSSELFVEKTVTDSPAEKSGLKAGDRLVAIGSTPIYSFQQLKDAVQNEGEKLGKVTVKWEHEGKLITQTVTPTATEGKDPLLNKITTYTVGVMPMLTPAQPEMVLERTYNPFKLVYKGTERMLMLTERNFVSIGKMLTGSVSSKTLGGPIMIGKIAGESLAHGVIAVLGTMALLSIGLGVLNVLPVPVLDGGHLLLLVIETVRGKPLTMRQMEFVQSAGLVLILMLMVLVFKNDITRMTS